jgi:hypothetical protein
MPEVTFLQQPVAEHGAERWGEGHREPMGDAFPGQSLQDAEKGEIRFRQRLEEPVFLEKIFVFRVPNEGEMGVKNESEMICHLGQPAKQAVAGWSCLTNFVARPRVRQTFLDDLERAVQKIDGTSDHEIKISSEDR